MSLTLTLNGTLGRSTSSFEREILRGIGLASPECVVEQWSRFLLRKNAAPINDTFLPILVPFGAITVAKFVYIHVINNATIRIRNSAAITNYGTNASVKGGSSVTAPLTGVGGPWNNSCDFQLGDPEGALILFAASITGIEIVATTTDLSEVEVYVAG